MNRKKKVLNVTTFKKSFFFFLKFLVLGVNVSGKGWHFLSSVNFVGLSLLTSYRLPQQSLKVFVTS